MMENRQSYAKATSCNKCRTGINTLSNIVKDGYVVEEADTKCNSCGFEDYWCWGVFESRQDGLDNAERYYFKT